MVKDPISHQILSDPEQIEKAFDEYFLNLHRADSTDTSVIDAFLDTGFLLNFTEEQKV